MLNFAHPNKFSVLIVMYTIVYFMSICYARILEVKVVSIPWRLAPLDLECRATRHSKSDEANKSGGIKQWWAHTSAISICMHGIASALGDQQPLKCQPTFLCSFEGMHPHDVCFTKGEMVDVDV